jgi:hypothetical protein
LSRRVSLMLPPLNILVPQLFLLYVLPTAVEKARVCRC